MPYSYIFVKNGDTGPVVLNPLIKVKRIGNSVVSMMTNLRAWGHVICVEIDLLIIINYFDHWNFVPFDLFLLNCEYFFLNIWSKNWYIVMSELTLTCVCRFSLIIQNVNFALVNSDVTFRHSFTWELLKFVHSIEIHECVTAPVKPHKGGESNRFSELRCTNWSMKSVWEFESEHSHNLMLQSCFLALKLGHRSDGLKFLKAPVNSKIDELNQSHNYFNSFISEFNSYHWSK
jgi:hypothetical protein